MNKAEDLYNYYVDYFYGTNRLMEPEEYDRLHNWIGTVTGRFSYPMPQIPITGNNIHTMIQDESINTDYSDIEDRILAFMNPVPKMYEFKTAPKVLEMPEDGMTIPYSYIGSPTSKHGPKGGASNRIERSRKAAKAARKARKHNHGRR